MEPANNGIIRDKKGRFAKGTAPGNPTGRNVGRHPMLELEEALEQARINHDKPFLVHFVERAYKNDIVAIALAKKLLPDKIEGEGFGYTAIYNIIQELQRNSQKDSDSSVELADGDGLHEGRTRLITSDKEVSE